MDREFDLNDAVLIVEDNYSLRTALAEVLEDAGYHVVTASSGATALRMLQGASRPRLMLLDLMMPVMTGWELLTHLERDQALASIPVIVLSAVAEYQRERLGFPIAAMLAKPVDLDTLLALVEQYGPPHVDSHTQ